MKRWMRRTLPFALCLAFLAAALTLSPDREHSDAGATGFPVTRTLLHTASPTIAPSALTLYRQRRAEERAETVRALSVLALQEDNPLVETARAELLSLSRYADAELAIEGAMLGAGYHDAVAVVRGDAVTLLVPGARPGEQDAAALLWIAVRYTGLAPEKIALMALENPP